MKKIEVGQTVYVHTSNMFLPSEPNLNEFIVTKVNQSSFYAIQEGTDYERRFNRKIMTSEFLGNRLKAYLTKEEYWAIVESAKEKEMLRGEITNSLHTLPVEKLRAIKEIINA